MKLEDRDIKVARIHLDKRVTVPPRSAKPCIVKLAVNFVCIQPFPELKAIIIPYSIVSSQPEVPVILNNFTDSFVTPKKGY